LAELKLPFKEVLGAVIALLVSSAAFAEERCGRVVSLAPSVTETFHALDLLEKVAAVSRYDHFPYEVEKLPRIGGLFDPSIETILALKPSLVVGLPEHRETLEKLAKLAVNSLTVDHSSVSGILNSLTKIANTCGVNAAGIKTKLELSKRIDQLRGRAGKIRPRVMVVIGSGGAANIKNLFISGSDGFYSELLRILGAENVYRQSTESLASLSAESLLTLNPEVIITITNSEETLGYDHEKIMREWQEFSGVQAVKNKRIYVLDKDYASIPGPRFVNLLEDLERLLMQGS